MRAVPVDDLKKLLDTSTNAQYRQARSNNKQHNQMLKQVQHDNQIFNAVAPQHPKREAYYHKKAKNMNLALPTFVKNTTSKGKIISSAKIESVLQYTFKKEI